MKNGTFFFGTLGLLLLFSFTLGGCNDGATPNVVTHRAISGLTDPAEKEPATGKSGISDGGTNSKQFDCTAIEWKLEGTDGPVTTFVKGTYTAIITLEAVPGYTFYGISNDFFDSTNSFSSLTTIDNVKFKVDFTDGIGRKAIVTMTFNDLT